MNEIRRIALGLFGVGLVLVAMYVIFSDDKPPGNRGHELSSITVKTEPVSEASVTTQSTKFVGKVTEVLNPDGVPLVRAVAMNEDFLGHKELAIATTNFVVGDVIRIVSVMAPGGKYFPVAMPVTTINSWP